MKIISLLLVLLFSASVTPASAQIGPDGTGFVNGYFIGPNAFLLGANLFGADLSGANLSGADLTGANLSGADFTGSIIVGTNFYRANLSGAYFSEMNLSRANFFGADLDEAVIGSRQTGSIITSVSMGHSEEIQALKSSDTTNTAAIATNTTNITNNTAEIEAIKVQLATLVDALAAKDAEIEQQSAIIAELSTRPTQAEFDAVVAERDERSTLEELQDARAGSVILAPDENGNVQLKLEIEESSDLEVWLNEGKKLEGEFQLAEGKKFMRFALVAGN